MKPSLEIKELIEWALQAWKICPVEIIYIRYSPAKESFARLKSLETPHPF